MTGIHRVDTTSLSERLADWVCGLEPSDLAESTRSKTRDIQTDIVGLCIATRTADYVAAAERDAAEAWTPAQW